MKEVILTFMKCSAASAFCLYTAFVIYGVYKLDVQTMMPLLKMELGFIIIIAMLIVCHWLTKWEEKLNLIATGKN